jgi:hypothetical protein
MTRPLLAEPWTIEIPLLLPQGRIARDEAGGSWWRSADGNAALPVANTADGLLCGTDLTRAAAIWSGNRLTILAAQTPWGRIGSHD